MDLGFVTPYSRERVEFAGKAGFDCLEVFVGEEYGFDLTDKNLNEALEIFQSNNIKFATIACVPNHLEPDPVRRKENNEFFKKALRTCKRCGTDIVMTNAWADKNKSPKENLAIFKEVFAEYARVAEYEGVKIAMENCPHALGYPMAIGNICYSPEMWDAIFDAVPSMALGLEFDPSHLYWQQIDYVKAIKDYKDRIYAFHAKDTEIVKEWLDKCGILGKQFEKSSEWDAGWWRYRVPGWGMIDWKGIFNALYEIEYKGPVVIEYEDPIFGGDRTEEGLMLGLKFLKQYAK